MSRLFDDPLILLLAVAFVSLGAMSLTLARKSRANPLRERLSARRNADGATGGETTLNIALGGTPLPPLWQACAEFGLRLAGSAKDQDKLARLLRTAGWRRPEAVGLLMCVKYGLGLVLSLIVLFGVVSPQNRLGLPGLAAVLMTFFAATALTEFGVKALAMRRHDALSRAMPDALDLMVICAEAGLPFPRIMKVVSRELSLSAPTMADELTYTSSELQLLPDRSAALRHLADRTQVATIQSMVGSLIQAERYGTPLAQALRTIAEESRTTHILSLEEKAGKLPAQLSVPLMTLILPPVVALVAAPALMRVIRTLMQ